MNSKNGIANDLANQIFQGNLEYDKVIKKYPNLKDIIDSIIEAKK